ncbi:biofilm regulation protein kinase SiaB [Salinicola acroporae]|uniref:ATP-binding protein n=1 Tax=Salinicola acroporae TaxID=1541440 RepID=A0ABT6I4N3_9GAMM|nr:biofilm regulation protein kinase SiaB [Salinicola acroporae]MDH4572632.1 hypothetical protein [Salinicola acroporae]
MDLLAMRESYQQQRVMLCFNGPISRSLIEEIGNALRNYLDSEQAALSSSMDVFAIYIEMTQNIRHYSRRRQYGERDATAIVAVGRDDAGRYTVSAGNLVEADDGRELAKMIEEIGELDKTELKQAYKRQLRQPRDTNSTRGAGLGLLDMARKSSLPLQARLQPLPNGQAFFSLTATV